MIRENQRYLNRALVFIDAICVFFAFVLSYIIRFKLFQVEGTYLSFEEYMKPAFFVIPIYLILYKFFNLYKPYRIKGLYKELFNILKTNVSGILIFTFSLFLFKMVDYSRYFLLVFFISCVTLAFVERFTLRIVLKNLRKRGYNKKYILIIGINSLTEKFIKTICSNNQWGYEILGIVDDKLDKGSKYKGVRILGKIGDLEKVLDENHIDEAFATLKFTDYDRFEYIVNTCEKSGVRMEVVPEYAKYFPGKPYLSEIGDITLLSTRYIPLDDVFNRVIKRTFDIIGSFIAIVVFSPVMLITAVMIKLTSKGPILFKQERVGYNKKLFLMYKFRSMRVQEKSEEEAAWTTMNDPRKTKFGNFIRKTSIDELPQLFNVLKGDMSLVGPRPERPYFVEQFKENIPKYMVKHQVLPGMTGWAQVNGLRGDTSIKKRIECDIYYIEKWSFWFDIKIMWFTVFRGFVNKNAY